MSCFGDDIVESLFHSLFVREQLVGSLVGSFVRGLYGDSRK